MITQKSERYKLFISYSHEDAKWLERVRIHLKPLERDDDVEIWDDTKIRAGSDWREDIKKAIQNARVALLLISADFIASDFITHDELPPLLDAAKNEGARIIPLLLSPSRFKDTKSISMFQAFNSPSNTLIDMEKSEQERILVEMTREIEFEFKNVVKSTPEHLSTEIINFQPYIDRIIYDFENWLEYSDGQRKPIIELFERANLYKYYVNLRCRDSETEYDPIDEYIEKWINEEDKNHIILLGDYGTGKSSFLLYLTYILAKSYKDNPINVPIPVFISLKNFKKIHEIKQLILDVVRNDYNIPISASFNFQHLLEDGNMILLLDGFDEMESKSNKDIILYNFIEISKLVTKKSKVILTSRTHYFKTHSQVKDIFNPQYDTELLKMIRGNPRFKIMELLEFNYNQIIEFLELHTNDYMGMWRKIKSTYNLDDLSKRPILLEMIIRTLPKLMETGQDINSSKLYEVYTNIWIQREDWRSVMDPDEKAIFMAELALYMFLNNIQSVHYTELYQIVLNHFKRTIISKDDADIFSTDARTCSFLNRDDSGNYKFIHKSFMEFFVAKQFYNEIINDNILFFKEKPLPPEIIDFMSKMDIDANRLYDLVYSTSNKKFEQIRYMGGNAISILNYMGETFINKDFSNTILRNANFEGSVCDNSNFTNAELQESSFIDSSMLYVNLEYAKLDGALIDGIGQITVLSLNKTEDKLAFGTINGNVSIVDLKNFTKILSIRETNFCIENIRFFCGDQFLGFLDSNKNIFIIDTVFFNKRVLGKWERMSVIGIDFNPSRPEIAILCSNMTIKIINLNTNAEKLIDLNNDLEHDNECEIHYLNDTDTIAIVSKNNIFIIDLQGRKPIIKSVTKLDYIEDSDYRSEEDSLYLYQHNKNSNEFNCEIVNLKDFRSEIIISESSAEISWKDNLMISYEFKKNPIFKVVNLKPNIFLFGWENVPGKESDLLVQFLNDEYEFNLEKIAINKSDDNNSITIFNHETLARIPIDENEKIMEIEIPRNYYHSPKIKVTRHKSDLVILGEKYNLKDRSYYFIDILYSVKNLEEIRDSAIDVDSRKLLNYLKINTGYEKIYKSADGKSIYINRERQAEITIDASEECVHLKFSNGRTQDMILKTEKGMQNVYKKILKESHNTSLDLEKPTEHQRSKYNLLILFSKNGKSVFISDYSGNLILWHWSNEPTIIMKEGGIWNNYDMPKSKTMLEARFINRNLFKCYYMNLHNTSGIAEEKIQALVRMGAVIE